MNKKPLISVAAVAAGLTAGIALTVGSDKLLEQTGLLPLGPHKIFGLHLLEVTYRSLYCLIGGYVAARLAPTRPVRHAIALGIISLTLNIVGAVATWHLNLAPAWFTLTLIVLALPMTWSGGKLHGGRNPAGITSA